MNTIYIQFDSDWYEINYVAMTVYICKKNNKPILFRNCPDDVKEDAIAQMENALCRGLDNPYDK